MHTVFIDYNINISQSKAKSQTNNKNKQTKSDITTICKLPLTAHSKQRFKKL